MKVISEGSPSPLDEILRLRQKCLETVPVVILGSERSMGLGIRGIEPFADFLMEKVTATHEEQSIWDAFKKCLTDIRDLEQALQQVTLNERLLAEVIRFTREMVVTDDLALFEKVVQRQVELPLSRLFSHLFRSTHNVVSVITTNYDRVAEYAANACHHRFHDGFTDGHLRHFVHQVHPATCRQIEHDASTYGKCTDQWIGLLDRIKLRSHFLTAKHFLHPASLC